MVNASWTISAYYTYLPQTQPPVWEKTTAKKVKPRSPPAVSDRVGIQIWEIWPQSFCFINKSRCHKRYRVLVVHKVPARSISFFFFSFCRFYVCMVCIVCKHTCRHGGAMCMWLHVQVHVGMHMKAQGWCQESSSIVLPSHSLRKGLWTNPRACWWLVLLVSFLWASPVSASPDWNHRQAVMPTRHLYGLYSGWTKLTLPLTKLAF